MDCSMTGLPIANSRSLLKFPSIESVMPSNHLILCHPLLPPSILPSIRVFSNESVLCIRWPTYWSFSFSISPSNEYSGLISFRVDWFDLHAPLITKGVSRVLRVHIYIPTARLVAQRIRETEYSVGQQEESNKEQIS